LGVFTKYFQSHDRKHTGARMLKINCYLCLVFSAEFNNLEALTGK